MGTLMMTRGKRAAAQICYTPGTAYPNRETEEDRRQLLNVGENLILAKEASNSCPCNKSCNHRVVTLAADKLETVVVRDLLWC